MKKTGKSDSVSEQRDALLTHGISETDIQALERGVVALAKTQLKTQMKDMARTQILSEFGSDDTFSQEQAVAIEYGMKQWRDQFKTTMKLGDPDSIHDWDNDAVEAAFDEVADAIRVRRQHLFKQTQENYRDNTPDPKTEAAFTDLSNTAGKLGVMSIKDAFSTDQMTIDLYDLGTLLFDGDSEPDPQPPRAYAYTPTDEGNILLDRLRSVLMTAAMNGGIVQKVQTAFKLKKLKTGLVKLGIYNDDFMASLTKEAHDTAITTLQAMLAEAFKEKASFHQLRGLDYDRNQDKIKAIIKNLTRLGITLTDAAITQQQQAANQAMYPAVLNAYRQATVRNCHDQKKQLRAVLRRLQSETPVLAAYTSTDVTQVVPAQTALA